MSFARIMCLLAALAAAPGAFADQPLQRGDRMIYSDNRKVEVFSSITGYTRAMRRGRTLWTIARHVPYGFVSNDGKYFVVQYDGANLIPTDFDPQLVLFTFYRNGKVIKTIGLAEIVSAKSQLVNTVSHYHWGNGIGFVGASKFKVERADGKQFLFNLATYPNAPTASASASRP